MKLLLSLLLSVICSAHTAIVYSEPMSTTVLEPSEGLSVLNKYHNLKHPDYLGEQAKWIWTQKPSSHLSATFQTLFHADCPQTVALLRITADGNFAVYLNDKLIGSGQGIEKVYLFELKLICGRNNLKVEVTNRDRKPHPALIFAIVQDQSKCYDCKDNPSAFYNRNTCQCQCSTQCKCPHELQKWVDYPFCGCKCNVYTFAACNPHTTFWDETSCSCKCKRKLCPYGWTQDPQTCDCQCQEKKCHEGQVWNPDKCWCEACIQQKCRPPKFWHQGSCSCICPLLLVPCPNGRNPVTCECYPVLRSQDCSSKNRH